MSLTLICTFLIAASYLVIAISRLLHNRINRHYKLSSFIRTLCVITIFVLIAYMLESFCKWFGFSVEKVLSIALALQILAISTVIYSYFNFRRTGTVNVKSSAAKSIPSVSVCIPARNETDELRLCLDSLLASEYSKLEVLVYDDSSQPKLTSQNKKMYANSGVKFITGDAPENKWLAKNYAYQRLLEEANGEILIFCGVDTRFGVKTVSSIVSIIRSGVTMLSLVPENQFVTPANWLKYLIQPTRYAWEIGLPRWLVNRPPVLSTCWAITKNAALSQGGFAAASRKVVPESYFARQCALHNLKYEFLYSDDNTSLQSVKLLSEQQSTAIRTRYPQLHRRIENVMFASLLILFVFIGPFVILTMGVLNGYNLIIFGSILCVLLGFYIYGKIVSLTYRKHMFVSYLVGPLAALYDVWLINSSMWQYEFGTVLWKGRNITDPVVNRDPKRLHLL